MGDLQHSSMPRGKISSTLDRWKSLQGFPNTLNPRDAHRGGSFFEGEFPGLALRQLGAKDLFKQIARSRDGILANLRFL